MHTVLTACMQPAQLEQACRTLTCAWCVAAEDSQSDVCIWAVAVLPDGTIVSGDSSSCITFWDGQHGTRLCQYTHKADVLCLAASPMGDMVFAGGRLPRVHMYRRVQTEDGVPMPCLCMLPQRCPHLYVAWQQSCCHVLPTD